MRFGLKTVVAATLALAAAGCRCGGGQTERRLTAVITDPTDGATFDIGAEVTVVVAAQAEELATGAKSDFEPVAGTLKVNDLDAAQALTLEKGRLTFKWVAAAPGTYSLKVVGVTEKDSSLDGASSEAVSITVSKDETPPEVTAVSFQGDGNADNCLNATELPSGAPTAVVAVKGMEDGQQCVVRRSDALATVYGSGVITNGNGAITLSQLPADPEATYPLAVECTDKAGNKNKVSGAPPLNTKALVTLKIDRVKPTVSLVAPTKELFGLADDDSSTVADFQFKVTAQTTSTDVTEIIVSADGKAVSCKSTDACYNAGTATVTLTLTKSGTRTTSFEVKALDGCGNETSLTKTITLDFDAPTINITAPVAANNPHTSYSQALRADVTDAAGRPVDGLTVGFFHRVGTGSEVSMDQVSTDAQGKASGGFSFVNGTYNIIARVQDKAGNPAEDTETGVVIAGTGCDLTVTRPATNPAFLTRANDGDVLRQDLQYVLRVQSSSCPNAAVLLSKCTSQSQCTAATSPFLDSGETAAKFTDTAGAAEWRVTMANGNHIIKAEITNTSGPPTPAFVDITVDLTTPTITFPVNNAVLRVQNDTDRTTAGVQTQLIFSGTVPVGGRVDICYNTTTPRTGDTACATGVSGWWTLKSNATSPDNTFTYPDSPPAGYSVIPVVVSGTTSNAGTGVALTVDSVRPRVTSVTIVGDANGDRRLNVAELAGGAPRLTIVTSEPASIMVRDQVSAADYMTARVQTGANNTATVDLNQGITSGEQDYQFVIDLRDAVTNTNVLSNPTTADPLDTNAFQALRVDKSLPSCTFTSPTKPVMGPTDDADAAAGYQLRAAVSTAQDVGSNGVTFNLTGAQTQTATVSASGGQAENLFTVASTGTSSYSLAATCTDQSGNPANATLGINPFTVDLDAPTCNLLAPTAGTYGSYSIPTTVSVSGVANWTPVDVFSAPLDGGARVARGGLSVDGGIAAGPITYPNGPQTVEAEVTDTAGNRCTTPGVQVTVNAVGCPLSVATPSANSYLNKQSDLVPGSTGTVEFNVTGSSVSCTGKTVSVYRSGSPRSLLATGTTDLSSNYSIQVSLPHGAVADLEVEIDNGAGVITPATVQNITVDLVDPTVSTVYPTGATLFVVADTNPNVPGNAAYVLDRTVGVPGDFDVTLSNVQGAAGGSARVLYNGSTIAGPISVTGDPANLTIPVNVTHATTGPFVIELRDLAGNTIQPTSATMTVDVIPPAAFDGGVQIANRRTATVSLTWPMVKDDGVDSASGEVTNYDVRWTNNAIKTATGAQTTSMSAADYFDSAKVKAEATVGSATLSHAFTAPPLSTYYVAVRAVDDVGNYSSFVTPIGVSSEALWTKVVLQNPTGTGSQFFGYTLANGGSLNNDGIDDLVVAASGTNNGVVSGAVYVYFGGSQFATSQTITTCGAGCQKIVAYDSTTATGNLGTDLSVANFGDVSGEGTKADLLVSSSSWSSSTGRAFIFFGNGLGGTLDSANRYVEFRGTSSPVTSALGTSARAIPDISNPPDGLAEVALVSTSETQANPNRGRVFIFEGRSFAAWQALATAVDPGPPARNYIPLSAATWTITGPLPVDGFGTSGNQFGRNGGGFTQAGDLGGFVVPASKASVNKAFVFLGSDVRTKLNLQTGSAPTPDDSLQVLSATPVASTSRFGFGLAAVGTTDLLGSTARDLAIGNALANNVAVFGGGASTFPLTPTLTIQATANLFGNSLAVSDVNGDGRPDLVVGENVTSGSSTWVLYSRTGSFDTGVGAGFNQSRLQGPTTSTLGISVTVGDFDGDSNPDIAAGDHFDSPGKVSIWR